MRLTRTLLTTVLVIVALVLQVTVLARLQLPGAVPDLLLLTVLGLALVYGHVGGALAGFGAGLLADIAPPADHAVGRYALVLCVIGYAAGLTRPETGPHRSATVPMIVVGAGAVASTLLYAGVGTLVGDTAVALGGLITLVVTATLYDLLLAPFAVPLVMALARKLEDDPLAAESVSGSAGGNDTINSWAQPSRASLFKRPGGSTKPWSPLLGRKGRASRVTMGGRPKAGRIKGVKRL
ncbi:rod shape-determining protein MreD [Streptomyces bohaiensis]|uniref:Rod shape-determining protein MreD n=1 Tax=Streptomyces bohaiensis TaxID=1431344 RepID=A0ABX1C4L7_9ACTN|nr:rod shape-determining protein MreD [Streptomyces bohaiensis]NJQ14161.1 rod shape-determining protein MreD [Streptomyces bohaiensis]